MLYRFFANYSYFQFIRLRTANENDEGAEEGWVRNISLTKNNRQTFQHVPPLVDEK